MEIILEVCVGWLVVSLVATVVIGWPLCRISAISEERAEKLRHDPKGWR